LPATALADPTGAIASLGPMLIASTFTGRSSPAGAAASTRFPWQVAAAEMSSPLEDGG
jgi:hypothetical protein